MRRECCDGGGRVGRAHNNRQIELSRGERNLPSWLTLACSKSKAAVPEGRYFIRCIEEDAAPGANDRLPSLFAVHNPCDP
jgi:hypothetical protein